MHVYNQEGQIYPLNRIIKMFVDQTELQLFANTVTQAIYPQDVYPGFYAVNEIRKRRAKGDHSKGWFSDGEGSKSFRGHIIDASDPSEVTIMFSFKDYMRYVDIGVGAGTKAEQVERSRNANYKRRYISKWNRPKGRSHRPAIMMELRHLQKRILTYLQNVWGYEGEFGMLNALEPITQKKR